MSEARIEGKEPFFVVGSDRSGTTMLRMMLDAHPGLRMGFESWFLIELMDALPLRGQLSGDQVNRAYEILCGHPRWRRWGVSDEALAACLEDLDDPDLSELVEAVFRQYLGGSGETRWGDKTPAYVSEIKRIHTVFPCAQFIHLIRDARDVCISLRKVRWHGPTLVHMARYWREQVSIGMETGRALGDALYLEVPYEALVTDLETTLRRICSFLGESFDPDMLDWHELTPKKTAGVKMRFHPKLDRAPRPSDTSRWKSELSSMSVAIVETCAGDVMDQANQRRNFDKRVRLISPFLDAYALVGSALFKIRRFLRRTASAIN